MINNTRGKTNLSFCSLHKNVKLLLYEQVSDHRLTAKNVSKKIEIKLSFFFFFLDLENLLVFITFLQICYVSFIIIPNK